MRGLVLSVKTYERLVIRAAVERSARWAHLALLVHPLIGEWDVAQRIVATFHRQDPSHGGLTHDDLSPWRRRT